MLRHDRWIISALLVAALGLGTVPGLLAAADVAKLATVEAIPGSELKRVVLTPQAAERLAIELGAVRERPVKRWLMVMGEVEQTAGDQLAETVADGGATASDTPQVRVRVPAAGGSDPATGQALLVLSLGAAAKDDDDDDDTDDVGDYDEDEGIASGIVVVPVKRESSTTRFEAMPIEAQGITDPNVRYYELKDADHGLTSGETVFVRLAQPGSGTPQKVIPYSAVIYDAQGNSWTYTNPEPLVFVRHPIAVEHIEGSVAILKDGPPVGTAVVKVGAAELLGIEQKGGQ